jgi:hypothetical protein
MGIISGLVTDPVWDTQDELIEGIFKGAGLAQKSLRVHSEFVQVFSTLLDYTGNIKGNQCSHQSRREDDGRA